MHHEDDLDRLLADALQQPLDARQRFLERHCADDSGFRSLLDALLRESDDADPFLTAGGAFDGPLWEDMLAESSELAAGTRLGPYEIRAPISSGGMGEVYRGHDTRLGRDVAIKILPGGAFASSHALARFEREARAVAALSHPNILAIHDFGSEGDVQYVVTELLEGETLRRRLAGGALSTSKTLDYGIQIAHGLAAAHDRGIVHRDVKPDNLFVTRDGRVKILDFGIASFDDEARAGGGATPQLTRSGIIPGTVGYTSPEQMIGKAATAQSDLFALGIVLHEMLTGVHPFARTTAPETLTAVLRDDPPSVLRTVPDVAPSLARIIERCLQKQPADRPETSRDVAFFLEVIQASREGGSADTGSVARFSVVTPSAPSLRMKLIALSCGLVVLMTAATWGWARVIGDRAVRAVADAGFARAERGVRRLHAEQITRLALTARLVASFPELKALLATDAATIEDFLLGYRQRLADAPTLIAVGPDGTVLARTDRSGPAAGARGIGGTGEDDWLAPLLAAPDAGAVVISGGRPYLAFVVASEAGGTVFGYLVAAEPINQAFAEAVREMTQQDVVLVSQGGGIGSTLGTARTPWPSLEAWHADGGRADRSSEVRIGSRRFTAREVTLSSDPPVSAILLRSRDEAVGPYRRIEYGIMAIAIVLLAAAILASLWLSRDDRQLQQGRV